MLLTTLAALMLTADAGSESLDKMIEKTRTDVCKLGKSRACDSFTAFLKGKPASTKPELLTMGIVDAYSIRGHSIETLEGFVLAVRGTPAEATFFRIRPENDQEKAETLEFIASFAAGKPDKKSVLWTLMQQGAASQPRAACELNEGSLAFEFNVPLGGHWVRAVGKKLYVIGFMGGTESPSIFAGQFQDPR